MIDIVIQSNQDGFEYVAVKGHANSDEYGKDLVCAAVSAVVIGAFNNIHGTADKEVVMGVENGFCSIEFIKPISNYDKIVIETLICQLKTIRESNKKFVRIIKITTLFIILILFFILIFAFIHFLFYIKSV